MEKQNVETIKMVDRALEVLDILRKERSPLGVNEIAKNCELNPSTAFRILKTLEVNGWVYQCMDGRYITGQKISFVIEKKQSLSGIERSGRINNEPLHRRKQAGNEPGCP